MNEKIKLQTQIKNSEDALNQIVQQRMNDKLVYEQERSAFQVKIRADEEVMSKQKAIISEQKNAIKTYQDLNQKLEDERTQSRVYVEEAKAQREEQSRACEDLKQELSLLNSKTSEGTFINGENIKQIETLQSKLREKEEILRQRGGMRPPVRSGMDIESDEQLTALELEKYRGMIFCTLCNQRYKNVMIRNCCHLFCKECAESVIKERNRKCPICAQKFDKSDIRDFFWN